MASLAALSSRDCPLGVTTLPLFPSLTIRPDDSSCITHLRAMEPLPLTALFGFDPRSAKPPYSPASLDVPMGPLM